MQRSPLVQQFLVDQQGEPVTDGITAVIGDPRHEPGMRLVYAATLNRADTGSVQLTPMQFLVTPDGSVLGDALGAVIGERPVWINRMVYAARTRQTRRIP